jgi:hypothetical protein
MKNSLEKWTTILFLSAGIFVSILSVESAALAFFNLFKITFIYLSLGPALVTAIVFTLHIRKDAKTLPSITIPALLLVVIISLILIFYPHDSFGGADQSIYSNLAVHLVNHSSFEIPIYLNNLPSNYAEEARVLYQGYPIWLGIQDVLFGDYWMLRSNVIIITLGLFSLFLVGVLVKGRTVGLATLLLFSSSMPFLWFSRETMTENLSLFLLWSVLLYLLLFLKTKNFIYLIQVFACSWMFGLTRFEGFLFQFVLLFVLPSLFILMRIEFKRILLVTIICFLEIISNIYMVKDVFIPIFFEKVVPIVATTIKQDVLSIIPNNVPDNVYPQTNSEKDVSLYEKLPVFIFNMMAKYNFVLVIFPIFLVTIWFLIRIRTPDESKKFFFVILILLLPEYYKLISPNISLTQPWLYRRYVYALLPFGYMSLLLFLDRLKNKKLLVIILGSLLLINVYLSSPILYLKNNWGLMDKMREITKDISQKDLVLIDYRGLLGNYDVREFLILQKGFRALLDWQLANTKFFPEQKVFNGTPYGKIFYLSALEENRKGFPSFTVVKKKELNVNYSQLIPSCQLTLLREEEGAVDVYDYNMISLPSAIKYCSLPKNDIINYSGRLYLYELIYNKENTFL